MELIYLWVEKFRNIENKGFNFSQNYDVNFEKKQNTQDRILQINTKKAPPKLFDGRVDNITCIIGKNGSGKTSILDMIGVRRYDRLNLEDSNQLKYFMVYHLKDNLFVIEGSNFDYIKNTIAVSRQSTTELSNVSEPYSIIVKKLDDAGQLEFKDCFNKDYNKKVDIINFRHQYSPQTFRDNQNNGVNKDNSFLFNRIYLDKKNTGYFAIYKMINDLLPKNQDKDNTNLFNFKNNMYLKIKQNIHINREKNLKIEKGFEELPILNIDRNQMSNSTNRKMQFINKLLYDFCYLLASWFFQLPEKKSELDKQIERISNIKIEDGLYHYYYEIISILLEYQNNNERYFNYNEQQIIKFIKEVVEIIQDFRDEWFKEAGIIIPINEHRILNENIEKFLQFLDSLNYLDDEIKSILSIFKVDFEPLSAGEEALVSLFSAIHHSLKYNADSYNSKAILLLDEPDSFMHPEWSRILINELISFLNGLDNVEQRYQIIITTHSPFIVSDLPGDHIIALEQNSNTGKCEPREIGETFGANIHDLLAQEFFMKSTVGEFAQKKINKIIKLLNEDENVNVLKDEEQIEYIISIIGEPLIKDKLTQMYKKVFGEGDEISKLKERISELEVENKELKDNDSNKQT